MNALRPPKDYELHELLGEGTYGWVYRATYRGTSERAVKFFKPGLVDLATMHRELEKLNAVREHAGVVTVYDHDLLGEQPYYAMGLHAERAKDDGGRWRGRSLEDEIGKIDAKRALSLLREVLAALSYLHRHQVVHCDVKASNVLLTDEGKVKLCDFGQSRRSGEQPGSASGTAHYASPEQLRGGERAYHWDVYSFGVLAWRMLSGGRYPRLGGTAAAPTLPEQSRDNRIRDLAEELAKAVEDSPEPVWPQEANRVPKEEREIIRKCLSLEVPERWTDLREVEEGFDRLDERRRMTRSRRLVGGFAGLTILALAGAGIATWQSQVAEKQSREAQRQSQLADGERKAKEAQLHRARELLWESSVFAWNQAELAYQEDRVEDALAYLAKGLRSRADNVRMVTFAASLMTDEIPLSLNFGFPVVYACFEDRDDRLIVVSQYFSAHYELRRFSLEPLELMERVNLPQVDRAPATDRDKFRGVLAALDHEARGNLPEWTGFLRKDLEQHAAMADNPQLGTGDSPWHAEVDPARMDAVFTDEHGKEIAADDWERESREVIALPGSRNVILGSREYSPSVVDPAGNPLCQWRTVRRFRADGSLVRPSPSFRFLTYIGEYSDDPEDPEGKVKVVKRSVRPNGQAVPSMFVRPGGIPQQGVPLDGQRFSVDFDEGSRILTVRGPSNDEMLKVPAPASLPESGMVLRCWISDPQDEERLVALFGERAGGTEDDPGVRPSRHLCAVLSLREQKWERVDPVLLDAELQGNGSAEVHPSDGSRVVVAGAQLLKWRESLAIGPEVLDLPSVLRDRFAVFGNVQFSPDGKTLAVGYQRGLQMLTWPAVQPAAEPLYHEADCSRVVFSAGGEYVASASGHGDGGGSRGYAQIWRTSELTPMGPKLRNPNQVADLRWVRHDRALLVSSYSADGSESRLWSLDPVCPLTGHFDVPGSFGQSFSHGQSIEGGEVFTVSWWSEADATGLCKFECSLPLPESDCPAWFYEALLPAVAGRRVDESGELVDVPWQDLLRMHREVRNELASVPEESRGVYHRMARWCLSLPHRGSLGVAERCSLVEFLSRSAEAGMDQYLPAMDAAGPLAPISLLHHDPLVGTGAPLTPDRVWKEVASRLRAASERGEFGTEDLVRMAGAVLARLLAGEDVSEDRMEVARLLQLLGESGAGAGATAAILRAEAVLLEHDRKLSEALQKIRQVVAHSDASWHDFVYAARLAEQVEGKVAAVKILREGAERFRGLRDAQFGVGSSLLLLEDYQNARAALELAYHGSAGPALREADLSPVPFHLSIARFASGDREAAVEMYREFLDSRSWDEAWMTRWTDPATADSLSFPPDLKAGLKALIESVQGVE